jgi:hypothetical protein
MNIGQIRKKVKQIILLVNSVEKIMLLETILRILNPHRNRYITDLKPREEFPTDQRQLLHIDSPL